jgi:hypothetical protein
VRRVSPTAKETLKKRMRESEGGDFFESWIPRK